MTILSAVLVLGFLVIIHEGGHYLAARAFGVRVSEFMVGLPGPSVGVRIGETRFGVTAVPLGGYARVCGMEAGPVNPHLRQVMYSLYRRGTANIEDVVFDTRLSYDEVEEALEVLVEWGCATPPKRADIYNTYRAAPTGPSKREVRRAQREGCEVRRTFAEGESRGIAAEDIDIMYDAEYRRQYRNLPFWKRAVILVAGPGVNLIFALLAFIVIFSIIGFDVVNSAGETVHMTVDPLRSIVAGFTYIGMVVQAVAGLFNPTTVGQVVSDSTSVVGIAVVSRQAIEAGFTELLEFTAMISVSLGIMNLIPIPPLDGGRLIVEVVQRITHREVSDKVLGRITAVGISLFMVLFVVMLGQDVERLFTGFWE